MTLEEKVELLIDCVAHEDELSKLALEMNWTPAKIRQIHDIMGKFLDDTKEEYNYMDVNGEFNKIRITYQDLKSIFRIFYDNCQYIPVIKRYLKTNHEAHGNVSCEYITMYEDLFKK